MNYTTGANCTKSTEGLGDRIWHKLWFRVIVGALALGISPAIFGQAAGSFSGNVLDKSGSSVVEATVTVINQGTGLERKAKTDHAGHYLIPLLPVGLFTVRVEARGFQTTESQNLNLQVQQAREVDFSLEPASVTTTVTVTGEAVAVETTNPSLGQVITSQQVSQLPLNGRDFVQLATLTAGATAETNPNSFFTASSSSEVAARGSFSLSVGGSRVNVTDWLLDGVDNNELTAGGIDIFSSIDDIQEFKVLTNSYSAEYGTRAGPTVLVTTKSGTNDYHGSLYEFVRNTDLNSLSYFATSAEKFNLNQFGGSVGGPIRKNKTFFFVDGEQKVQLEAIAFEGLIPTPAMVGGDFSDDPFGNPVSGLVISNPNMYGASTNPSAHPSIYFQCDGSGNPEPVNADGSQPQGTACNKIPSGLFNNVGQAMMKMYPAPNVNAGDSSASYNYANEPVRSLYETKFDVRLDQTFSARDDAFARFSYDQASTIAPGGGPGLVEASPWGATERLVNNGRNFALGETHVFSARTINQATVGYDRIFDYIMSLGSLTCDSATIVPGGIPGADLGCTAGSTQCAPGSFSCGLVMTQLQEGYWSVGDRAYAPFMAGTNIFSYRDTLELIRGTHDIRFGFDIRDNQMNVATEAFENGYWVIGGGGNFSGYTCPSGSTGCTSVAGNPEADFLLGLTGLAIHDQTFGGVGTGRRWKIIRPFVEDDWRVVPSLTFNLGLAWAMATPETEVNGRIANYDVATGKLLVANQNGVSASADVQMDWTAFEPRVGFAWKVLGSDKTVLRAGYGMYHDSSWNQGSNGLWLNPPFLGETDVFPSAGCTFATSYCAVTLGQAPTGLSLSSGFAPLTSTSNLANFTGTYYNEPMNLKQGRVEQFNVDVERQLGGVVLTAGYVGSRGNHILRDGNDLNTGSPSACGTVPGYTLGCLPSGQPYVPPYTTDDAIEQFADDGDSTYNSLQIKAETKTPKHGLYALFTYTYSRTYDNGLADNLGSEASAPYFPLPNWRTLDWSLSDINLDNSFTGSVIYDLPVGRGKMFGDSWNGLINTLFGDYQLTLIERISSGFPVPVIDSVNQSGTNFENNDDDWNRPNQVSGCNPYAASHGKLQWINASCFVPAPVGELGNAPRMPVSGPDFVNSDASLVKDFAIPRREMGLNFRAEFFNLFNHPQFGMPENDVSAIGFGSSSSTVNNPRLIQLALKLTF